jgi:hypothetical protein
MTVNSAFPLTPHFATLSLDKNPNLYFWYSDKQNRVLLLIVFIQKAIAYSCVNKIQICKHESCSIQCIEPCEKKNELKIN